MTAVEFKEQNIVFTKPESMTDEECGSLPAYRGDGVMISCWELTDEDISNILKDRSVWLHVTGNVHPPVCLSTGNPFV